MGFKWFVDGLLDGSLGFGGEESAGASFRDVLTRAPGNDAPLGGVKVVAEHGWFAARPSGTEDIYKLYAEALDGEERLEKIIDEAQELLG